jgi:uncharacterized protein YeaO (DUF488 family)
MGKVEIVRVYGPTHPALGQAVLVDRLWPRGVRREAAPFEIWLKEVAPSPELRKWYGHLPEKFPEFERRYREELKADPAREAFKRLKEMSRAGPVVLLTATKDLEHSGAAVLRDALGRSR